MLSDLDQLMHERGIDVVLVPMHEAMHPAFRWLARGAKITRGYALKAAGRDPVLVTYPMEREEAAATGLEVRLVHELDYEAIFAAAATAVEGYATLFGRMLVLLDAGDRIAFFGNGPLHLYPAIAAAMNRQGWRVHDAGDDLIQLARKRKETWEIEAIRSVGARTEDVVDGVRAMLRSWSASMTLGDLKRFISEEIARLGMIEDHDTIVSQGRDAAIPHSRGDAAARIRPSLPIVVDIFPADKASGYFFDMTRTFCVGEPSPELRRIHEHVHEAFCLARDAMVPGTPASSYQAMVSAYFEARGYATTRSAPRTVSGYVHGLGHGVGLDLHERPSFSLSAANGDQIETGDIVTIEPGLYFPDRAIGVRIEDTFLVTADGVETLCRSGYGLAP